METTDTEVQKSIERAIWGLLDQEGEISDGDLELLEDLLGRSMNASFEQTLYDQRINPNRSLAERLDRVVIRRFCPSGQTSVSDHVTTLRLHQALRRVTLGEVREEVTEEVNQSPNPAIITGAIRGLLREVSNQPGFEDLQGLDDSTPVEIIRVRAASTFTLKPEFRHLL